MKPFLRAFPLFIALYGIVFSQLTEFGRNNNLTISGVIGLTILFAFLIRYFYLDICCSYPSPLLLFLISLCAIGGARVVLGIVPLRDSIAIHIGLILSGAIVLYLNTFPYKSRIAIINMFVYLIAAGFVLQLLFSIYESMMGEIIGVGVDWLVSEYSVADAIAAGDLYRVDILHERFIGNAIYPSLSQLLFSGLTIPFTGLLGQHNYWGTQLPFLNLLFALWYLETKNRYFIYLQVLVLISVVMNTSRFGLGAILLTDFVLIRLSYPRYRYITNLFMVLIAGLAFLYLFGKQANDGIDYQNASTFLFRLAIWASLIILIGNFSLMEFLLGMDPIKLKDAMSFSLESQFFYLIFNWGVLGIIIVILFIYSMKQLYKRLSDLHKVMVLLVGVNALFVSALANQIFEYTTVTIIMLILSHIIWRSEQYQKIDSGSIP